MSFGSFNSSEPTMSDDLVSSFVFNKSLQQRGLEFRLGGAADDIRYDIRLVGGALLKQQEYAAKRYERAAGQTTDAVERQTGEVVRMREEQAANARQLRSAVEDSTRVLQKSIDASANAVTAMHGAVIDQLSHVRWALAEQNHLLSGIFETLREGRSNECRQLVEQGERNMEARFYNDAEERLKLALTYDNTDHVLHQNLGLVSVHLGKPDVALEHFKKALAFPPKIAAHNRGKVGFFLARAATHAARVLYARGDYRGTAEYLQQALKHDPRGAKNWYDLAVVSAYEGDAALATDALRRAIDIEPEFYAQALGDTELDPIRDAVDRLLLDVREEKRQTVEEALPRFETLQRLSGEVRRLVPTAPTVPPDLEKNLVSARQRNTFFAWQDVHTGLLTKLLETPRGLLTAVKHAIDALEGKQRRALEDAGKAHQLELQRREGSRREAEAQLKAEKSSALFEEGWLMGCFAYALMGVIGGVIGAALGTFVHQASWGFLLVALALPMGYAMVHGSKTATLQSATDAAETAVKDVRSEITRDAEAKRGKLERELHGLRALRTEIATAFNL
jgi:tetratricopeptide (TPR) repeat protein